MKRRPSSSSSLTVKIAFIFTSLSAVQIYDFHIFTAVYSPLHGFIWNQHSGQLPVGLLAQLVEHCTSIAEVMGSNPVQAWIFFRPSFHYCLSRKIAFIFKQWLYKSIYSRQFVTAVEHMIYWHFIAIAMWVSGNNVHPSDERYQLGANWEMIRILS